MSNIVLTIVSIIGAAVLGVGAGTGWWFTLGQGAVGTSSEHDDAGEHEAGPTQFVATDLSEFLLTEARLNDTLPNGYTAAVDDSATAPYCLMVEDCLSDVPGCITLSVRFDGSQIEPVALAAQDITIVTADPNAAALVGTSVAQLYPDAAMAQAEFERIAADAAACADAPAASASVTTDEQRGNTSVIAGHTFMNVNGLSGSSWATLLRGNTVVRIGFSADLGLPPTEFAPVLDELVEASNAATFG